jgi:hypothetical protein
MARVRLTKHHSRLGSVKEFLSDYFCINIYVILLILDNSEQIEPLPFSKHMNSHNPRLGFCFPVFMSLSKAGEINLEIPSHKLERQQEV